jgi:hypothetical protein
LSGKYSTSKAEPQKQSTDSHWLAKRQKRRKYYENWFNRTPQKPSEQSVSDPKSQVPNLPAFWKRKEHWVC